MSDIGNIGTDFQSHYIEGYAAMAPELGEFKVPLITEILPGLWQGGCIDGVELPEDFDYVLSLYPWEKYKLGPNTFRMEIRAYDSAGEVPEFTDEVEHVYGLWKVGKKVLVHCQAGLNRSGLFAAQVLMLDGYTPTEAIAKLRETRCGHVLCNRTFEQHLLGLAGE